MVYNTLQITHEKISVTIDIYINGHHLVCLFQVSGIDIYQILLGFGRKAGRIAARDTPTDARANAKQEVAILDSIVPTPAAIGADMPCVKG